MDEYDVVFPLNFGLPASLAANMAIAAAAVRESRARNIPIFFAPRDIFDFGDYPHCVAGDFPGYVSTVKQVDALAAAAAREQWRRVLVIAAPPHAWRARRDVLAANLAVGMTTALGGRPPQIWYSKLSEHRQTTSWWRWWFTWELPARAMLLVCRRCYEKRAGR